jgi:hypothetical protein
MNVGAPILEVESDFRLLEKGVDRIKGLSLAEVPNSVFAESGQAQLWACYLNQFANSDFGSKQLLFPRNSLGSEPRETI